MYQIDNDPQQGNSSWYSDLLQYLSHGVLDSTLSSQQKRAIRLKAASYRLVQGKLFRKHYNGMFLRCLEHDEAQKVLTELHDGPTGGHYAGDTTAHKIMRAGFYWPTLFRDAHAYVRRCDQCQIFAKRESRPATPLQAVVVEEPFQQ